MSFVYNQNGKKKNFEGLQWQNSGFLVEPISEWIKLLYYPVFSGFKDEWIHTSDLFNTNSQKIMSSVARLTEVFCTWFLHVLHSNIINMFIESLFKLPGCSSNIIGSLLICCMILSISNFVVGIYCKIEITFSTLPGIYHSLSIAIDGCCDVVCLF